MHDGDEKRSPRTIRCEIDNFLMRATGFEPTTSRARSKRWFVKSLTCVEKREVARQCNARTTRSRRFSAFVDDAEHSSAPWSSKIGPWVGYCSGFPVATLNCKASPTPRCSGRGALTCFWRDAYDERWQFRICKGGGLLSRVPCMRKCLLLIELQHRQWRREELHPRPEIHKSIRSKIVA
jgi:hypothetical protein